MIRVWDIHPGYLSRESLLGQHVEIHAIYSIITAHKKGYANHPETMRWRSDLEGLVWKHDLTVNEMRLRGYGHKSPLQQESCSKGGNCDWVDPPHLQFGLLQAKYAAKARAGRIPLPQRGSQFWAHHKYGVMSRGYNCYQKIQAMLRAKKDCPMELENELVASVLEMTRLPMEMKALQNTVDHLWGYFKQKANGEEQEFYLEAKETDPASLLPCLYRLACKYDLQYLRHSTVFADPLPGGPS